MTAGAALSPSPERKLDEAIASLKSKAGEFARLSPAARAALLRACMPRIADAAPAWVAEGCKAKGLSLAQSGEEWIAGPGPTLRNARLLAESLEAIARHGRPPLGAGSRERRDGRLEIDLFPTTRLDQVMFFGFTGHVLMQPGIDRAAAIARQAARYQRPSTEGSLSLVLGAGNVSSIPPMDCFTKMFIEGHVCLLKMNPVNEWAGQYLERALAPLIAPGYLAIVYGGADVGKYLVEHPAIDDVHITGSDRTHDLIVWGPPGPERERRKREHDPLLKRPISSELGNISPVAIVPYTYSDEQLAFQARNVVTMLGNNVSFNCNAAKMIITAEGWVQREQFFTLVEEGMARLPARRAYYPGAAERYDALTRGRDLRAFGERSATSLPWTLIRGVDARAKDDVVFTTEPFCPILSETQVGSADPIEFLATVTDFMNDRLWGTLNACVVIAPELERDATVGKALDRAVVDLRYGTVGINHWPALGYALGTLPWGGHPSATLTDIQSGLGWVHNTFMLDGIDKAVVRGPIRVRPTPPWFFDNQKTAAIGKRLLGMELAPSWRKLPGLIAAAL